MLQNVPLWRFEISERIIMLQFKTNCVKDENKLINC